MSRKFIVTGAGSGIGLATKKMLERAGGKVVGVDIRNSEVIADLSTKVGRQDAVLKATQLCGGAVDGVIACAGSALPNAKTVSINYFGATEFVNALNPLLKKSSTPRAAIVSSMASFGNVDNELVRLLVHDNEEAAIARAEALVKQGGGSEALIYGSTKQALNHWIRRECIKEQWAKAGIPLNGVGPGIVETPMVTAMIDTKEGRDMLAQVVPMPLNGYMKPEAVASLLLWLTGVENTHTTGQIVFIDGGSDAVLRGPNIFNKDIH